MIPAGDLSGDRVPDSGGQGFRRTSNAGKPWRPIRQAVANIGTRASRPACQRFDRPPPFDRVPEAGDRPAPFASRPAGFAAPVSGQPLAAPPVYPATVRPRNRSRPVSGQPFAAFQSIGKDSATVANIERGNRWPRPASDDSGGQGFAPDFGKPSGLSANAGTRARIPATVRPCAGSERQYRAAGSVPRLSAVRPSAPIPANIKRGNRPRLSAIPATVRPWRTPERGQAVATVRPWRTPERGQAVANIERAAGSGQPSASPAPVASRPRRKRPPVPRRIPASRPACQRTPEAGDRSTVANIERAAGFRPMSPDSSRRVRNRWPSALLSRQPFASRPPNFAGNAAQTPAIASARAGRVRARLALPRPCKAV